MFDTVGGNNPQQRLAKPVLSLWDFVGRVLSLGLRSEIKARTGSHRYFNVFVILRP